MDPDSTRSRSLGDLQEELQRKVGRNLLRFQQIERLMKHLVINARLTTSASGIPPAQAERKAKIQTRSMGQVLKQFFEDVVGEPKEDDSATTPVATAQVTTTFRVYVGADAEQIRQYQDQFGQMLEQRNQLVHHFLSEWPLSSEAAIRAAIEHLDLQRKQVIPLHDHLQSMVDQLRDTHKELAAFLNSEEGHRQFELGFLQQSRLVSLLFEAAQTLARPDGWTLLSTAGQLLRREAPEDFAAMKPRYGHSTLKRLVAASELFDLWDEATQGGLRSLYRIKAASQLSEV